MARSKLPKWAGKHWIVTGIVGVLLAATVVSSLVIAYHDATVEIQVQVVDKHFKPEEWRWEPRYRSVCDSDDACRSEMYWQHVYYPAVYTLELEGVLPPDYRTRTTTTLNVGKDRYDQLQVNDTYPEMVRVWKQ
jgi:hypothetical protein